MDCTIPALLIALKASLAHIPSQGAVVSENLVCGCGCETTRSGMLECLAAEERAKERWLEKINELIASCDAEAEAEEREEGEG